MTHISLQTLMFDNKWTLVLVIFRFKFVPARHMIINLNAKEKGIMLLKEITEGRTQ